MNYNVITDIYGNVVPKDREVSNNYPFILIHTTQPQLMLQKITTENANDGIWKVNIPTVEHILYNNQIDPNTFSPLGDIWLNSNELPNKFTILLVNNNPSISMYPIDFVKIDNYIDISIWKPIAPRGYYEMGLVASHNKPPLKSLKVVNTKYLMDFKSEMPVVDKNTAMNEFNLLSNVDAKKFTINRTKFMQKSNDVSISQKDNGDSILKDQSGYLKVDKVENVVDNKTTCIVNGQISDDVNKLKSKVNDRVNYTASGEMKIDNECIGISQNNFMSDNYAYLQTCDDNIGQKWYPYDDTYVSQGNLQCLSSDFKRLATSKCDPADHKQKWSTKDYDSVLEDTDQKSNESWVTQTGQKVVLVEPDNPWYVTKKNNMPIGIIKQDPVELNKVEYRDNADYHSNFMMDFHRADLGLGHSYAAHQGRPCTCLDCSNAPKNDPVFEYFAETKDKKQVKATKKSFFDFNVIASSLLFLILLLIVIRFSLSGKKGQ